MTTTSSVDVVKTFISAAAAQDRDTMKQFLSGDFVARGWRAQPLNKGQFLDLFMALKKAQPDLLLTLRDTQEDSQVVQSKRVDATLCLVDPTDEASAAISQEPVSFTVMGSIIESMVIALTSGGELERALQHLASVPEQQERPSLHSGPQEAEQRPQDQALYNKQSNLYDPKGKTYTPSRDALDYAPQVDAAPIAHEKEEDAGSPLFKNRQEQRAATSRQQERSQEDH